MNIYTFKGRVYRPDNAWENKVSIDIHAEDQNEAHFLLGIVLDEEFTKHFTLETESPA